MAERASFEEFFEANRRRAFGAFCLITGNRHEAEELVQDAFLKLWERWDRVARVDDPVAYLLTTGMNHPICLADAREEPGRVRASACRAPAGTRGPRPCRLAILRALTRATIS